MTFALSQTSLAAIHAHACEAYPDECCGMLIARAGHEEVVRVTNIQNELHAQDPEQFPRTAVIAYTMGPEAAPFLVRSERGELRLLAIYHSHPDHDAYFSEEDRKQAFGGWDEPNYPQAAQIVLSVRNREVCATKVFVWNAAARDYVDAELRICAVP
jgi:proteasome lid subunit RPN8/RPN11